MSNKIIPFAIGLVGVGLLSIGIEWGGGGSVANAQINNTVSSRGTNPTIVWFGVTSEQGGGVSSPARHIVYHRMWSDGKIEMRYAGTVNGCQIDTQSCNWVVVPSEPSNVSCRSDLNGDQQVGVEDLLIVVSEWEENAVCEPSFDCIDLGNICSVPAM